MTSIRIVCCLLCSLAVTAFSFASEAEKTGEGIVVEVRLPVTATVAETLLRTLRIAAQDVSRRAVSAGNQPTLFLVLSHSPGEEEYSRLSRFGGCYEIAEWLSGPGLAEAASGIRTVAFVPQTLRGHAVLLPLACDEIFIAPNAEFGDAATSDDALTDTMREAYREIARRRRHVPLSFIDKMLDPRVAVTEAEPPLPAGMAGLYTAADARRYGLVDFLAEDLLVAAKLVGVSPESLRRVREASSSGRTLLVDIAGPFTPHKSRALLTAIQQKLNNVHSNNGNITTVCFLIDSPGGDLDAAIDLADLIVKTLRSRGIRTVAYVPQMALADAALVAVVCDEVIVGETAQLGGDGAAVWTREEINRASRQFAPLLDDALVPRTALAMIDPEITGKTLMVRGDKAISQRLATATARDFAEVRQLCGIEGEPEWLAPGAIEQFVRALADPRLSLVLLIVALMSLSAELKAPGLGAGGFVAALCFVLFFWSQFLGGTAGWLEVLLFAAGVIFLLLEIFVVPGFGLFGVGGMVLVVLSIVLAGQTFFIPRNSYQLARMQWSLMTLLVASGGATLVSAVAVRRIHAMSRPAQDELKRQSQAEQLVDYTSRLGQNGITVTPLVPAGKVAFGTTDGGTDIVDVVADGEFIDSNTLVVVTAVVGYRVIVAASR